MESKVTAVCVIIELLGALAASLSFAAETKRIKAFQVSIYYPECNLPRSTLSGLGIGAALALFLSQIIISFETGCFSSTYTKLPINRSLSRLYSFVSRIAYGIAIVLLIAAVAMTGGSQQNNPSTGFDFTVCYVLKPGVFAAAGIFSLVSVSFGVLYCRTLSAGTTAAANSAVPLPPQANTGNSLRR